MSRTLNSEVKATVAGYTFVGEVGKHGEVVKGSWYLGKRALLSVQSDLSQVGKFDGLIALNTQGELSQLLGVIIHGDIFPFNWKTVADGLIKGIHSAVGRGRAVRKIISSVSLREEGVLGGEDLLFGINLVNFSKGPGLSDPLLGIDDHFLMKQGRVLINALGKPSGKRNVKFLNKVRLVGQDPKAVVLVANPDG